MPTIIPNLWFDTQAEEAAAFYTSIFGNPRIGAITHYGQAGPAEAGLVMTVEFELDGQRYVAINGGPEFRFNEAISLEIRCESQDEIDLHWSRLTADGGEEGACGWLKDKYGVAWQVTHRALEDLIVDPDRAKVDRVMKAVLQMGKIDVAELERAAAAAWPRGGRAGRLSPRRTSAMRA
jgi:predicted 3-demethylubiquinone-9 3-methyltransferase (glyoxalase superfamily)